MTKSELKKLLKLTENTDPVVRKCARVNIRREFKRLNKKITYYELETSWQKSLCALELAIGAKEIK
jgi:hypothetical protein